MRKIIVCVLVLLLGPVLPAWAEVLHILTTTTDLKSIAEEIGRDKVKVESLGRGDQNYHFLEAKPSFMVRARRADLFIRNGMDLEIGYEPLILQGSRNRNIRPGRIGHLDASEGIAPLDVPDKVDRSMGDIHAHGNPHYWLDPLNAKIIAGNIAARLSELSPEDAPFFQSALDNFNARIDRKMTEWQSALSPYRGEKVISYHETWVYFARRFGFEVAGELEPKPGVPPSPSHLRNIVDLVTRENVKVILNENIYRDGAARYVADRTGAAVVVLPISVGGAKDASDYFALIDRIIEHTAKGFQR